MVIIFEDIFFKLKIQCRKKYPNNPKFDQLCINDYWTNNRVQNITKGLLALKMCIVVSEQT